MRISIVLDCADPDALEPFWTRALGYERASFPSETFVVLVDPARARPVFILQRVPEPKTAKNRMHIDLHCGDLEAEIARMETLGATRAGEPTGENDATWIVMRDPEGNEFCLASP